MKINLEIKIKKELLKKKVLLVKNQYVEIGMIIVYEEVKNGTGKELVLNNNNNNNNIISS